MSAVLASTDKQSHRDDSAPRFNPESQVQHLDPDPKDPNAPTAYVCGIPVWEEREESRPELSPSP